MLAVAAYCDFWLFCRWQVMHPAVYLLSPYYEHWVHTVEHYGKAMSRAGGIGLADSVYRTMLQMQEAKEAKAS